jgi:hypothetical protein
MRAFVMASIAAAVAFTAAVAQAAPVNMQEVKVPFSFTVNGQALPAGTYTVEHDDALGTGTLLLRGEKASVFVMTTLMNGDQSPADDASFVFAKDGDNYRLTQVWDGDANGHEVVK